MLFTVLIAVTTIAGMPINQEEHITENMKDFSLIDKDGDGKITKEELKKEMRVFLQENPTAVEMTVVEFQG